MMLLRHGGVGIHGMPDVALKEFDMGIIKPEIGTVFMPSGQVPDGPTDQNGEEVLDSRLLFHFQQNFRNRSQGMNFSRAT